MLAANDTPDFPHVCSDQVADVYAQPGEKKIGELLILRDMGTIVSASTTLKRILITPTNFFVLFRWTSSAHIVYSERLSSNTVNTLPFRYIEG